MHSLFVFVEVFQPFTWRACKASHMQAHCCYTYPGFT